MGARRRVIYAAPSLSLEVSSALINARDRLGPGMVSVVLDVMAHGDGTGTVVLEWYETSVGHDYMTSETFMRTNIDTARQIVMLLNQQLPNRVSGITEYKASECQGSDHENELEVDKKSLENLSQRIHDRLIFLLGKETDEEQQDIAREMEHELEKLGEWVSMGNMSPQEYCTQVFLMAPEYVTPILKSAIAGNFDLQSAETARDLTETFLAFLPAWTHAR
jgi:hypothetical protein